MGSVCIYIYICICMPCDSMFVVTFQKIGVSKMRGPCFLPESGSQCQAHV